MPFLMFHILFVEPILKDMIQFPDSLTHGGGQSGYVVLLFVGRELVEGH